MTAAAAVARRTFAASRVQTISFAAFLALISVANVVGYRHSYATLEQRIGFARSFANNTAVRLFFGVPRDLLSVGGYAAWRVGGIGSVFAAVWGVAAAVRAMRGEEEAGRQEIVLAGVVGRRSAFVAELVAIAGGIVVLGFGVFAGLVAGRLPVGGSAFMALATVSAVPVFAAVGALTSQLAPARRIAFELAIGALGVALLLRVVADTSSSLQWLRWLTPLGWVEEMRAFAGPRAWPLLLQLGASALLLGVAAAIAVRRDIGRGLIEVRDSRSPRLELLGSPTALALRSERGSLVGWGVGLGFFAFVIGSLSNTVATSDLPASLERQLEKLGVNSLSTPEGAIGLYFLFFILAIALFGCSQVAAARREEAGQSLETLLAEPVSRASWWGGRILLAVAAMAGLALLAGLLAWAGADLGGAGIPLTRMLEAGANCLPAALLFFGIAALAFGVVPRASTGIAYGVVSVAFVWDLFGSVLGAPSWVLDLSPFRHVGLVPSQPFRAGAAAVMLAIGAAAVAVSMWAFRRRDLTGG
jgi:ABC-2 type transport system permease protein